MTISHHGQNDLDKPKVVTCNRMTPECHPGCFHATAHLPDASCTANCHIKNIPVMCTSEAENLYLKGSVVKLKGSGVTGVIDAVFINIEDRKAVYRIVIFSTQGSSAVLAESHVFTLV